MQLPLTSEIKRSLKASAGELRYNTDTNEMQAYDGSNWIPVTESFKYRLEISSGTIYGADYYTVAPINAENQWDEMMAWMVTTFDPVDDSKGVVTPNQRWYVNNAKFWFKNKKDLDWFVLRWSSQ
jgi:hypothetical protein